MAGIEGPKFWNSAAKEYHNLLESGKDALQDEVNTPALLKMLPQDDLSRLVFDAGCGNGRFAFRMLADHPSWTVVGCDSSAALVMFAARQAIEEEGRHRARFFVYDLNHPFSDSLHKRYDIAVLKMVIPSLKDIQPALTGIGELVRSGGLMLVSTLHEEYFPYLRRQDQADRYFYGRNLWVVQATWPQSITLYQVRQAIAARHALIDAYPGAIWAHVAGSRFVIPVYLHKFQEITDCLHVAGFELVEAQDIIVSSEFGYTHPEYNNRIGTKVLQNTLWRKK